MAEPCRISRVVVPFAVDPSESTPFTRGSHRARLRTYYRSSIATFGTLRRFNAGLECAFATNAAPPQWVADRFERLNVRLEYVAAPSLGLLPAGVTFRTSLYTLDVLRVSSVPEGTAVAYLDPDVLCIRPLQITVEDGQVGYLPLGTAADDSIKGLTLNQIAEISASMGHPLSSVPTHVGGEILVVTAAGVLTLTERIDEALAHLASGSTPSFRNEEHVLTYARGRGWCSLRPFVARIWTAARYHDVPDDALALALWHVPAEKTRGLRRVYRAVRRGTLDRTADDHARQILGRWVGVIPSFRRTTSDHVRRAARRFAAGVHGCHQKLRLRSA